MFSFTNKKVLITGATGGIGESITRCFLQSGAIVCAVGSSDERLAQLKEKLSDCDTSRMYSIPCNLKNLDDVQKLPQLANEAMEGLDVLVCNAGITRDNLAIRMRNEDWQEVIDVNLTANFVLNRESCKIMMKKKYGRIINIASVIGLIGNAGQANYAASKGGLIAMSKSFSKEFAARNITVNVVAPGFIDTAMTDVLPESIKEQIKSEIPMGKTGKPEEIASSVLFLASDEASYITGAVLNVNGGMC